MKLTLVLLLTSATVIGARAEDFVFETTATRLVIRPDAVVSSLIAKRNGKELLRPGSRQTFAAVGKGGRTFQASAVDRRGDLLHVKFGTSGIEADYRLTAHSDYLIVELTAFHGDGIEQIFLMQLNVSQANAGEPLSVRWDDEFAVCLIGLSAQVDTRAGDRGLLASVYPEFSRGYPGSTQGERVAVVAVPTLRFLETVRVVERDFRLPSPTIGGRWAKTSQDVRTSYLFTDLTEANADETIRYAKLGGFRYILVYSDVWSASLGSYPINTRNFPRGEESLKAVIDKCHAAGLKVGMHMMTSLVGKDDPLVTPKPSPGLLKDANATLAVDVNEGEKELQAALPTPSPLARFPVLPGPYGPASDILIDDEIVHYTRIDGATFVQCERGFAGTKASPHTAGAKIYHLAERAGAYLADLKTSLKDTISERVAGLINRCGFDMIYFDGGEVNGANGPDWYWLGPQQMRSGKSRSETFSSRGPGCRTGRGIFFPGTPVTTTRPLRPSSTSITTRFPIIGRATTTIFCRLNSAGRVLQDAPDHPATTPDEVEYYAVRMLALDSAVSLETTLDALKANGRTGEMLKLLGDYEQFGSAALCLKAVRQQLAAGEWHMTRLAEFHPIRYDEQRIAVPGEITVRNEFPSQPLKFRLQAASTLAGVGDPSNIVLLRPEAPVELQLPADKAVLPGSLVRHFEFPKTLDLTKHRALAVRLDAGALPAGSGEKPVLNIQLEADGQSFRDYYVDLDSVGPRTVILAEPGTKRMLAEFRPGRRTILSKRPCTTSIMGTSLHSTCVGWVSQRTKYANSD